MGQTLVGMCRRIQRVRRLHLDLETHRQVRGQGQVGMLIEVEEGTCLERRLGTRRWFRVQMLREERQARQQQVDLLTRLVESSLTSREVRETGMPKMANNINLSRTTP